MGTPGSGRKRAPIKDRFSAEDEALSSIAREAEARLAAKRAARAEARDIRMRELERQQKEPSSRCTTPALSAAALASLGGSSSRRGSGDAGSIVMDAEASISELRDIYDLKDQIQDVEGRYMQGLKELKVEGPELNALVYLDGTSDWRERKHGLVIIPEDTPNGDVSHESPTSGITVVTQEAAQVLESAGDGPLDVRLRKLADEKDELLSQIRKLKMQLEEERQKHSKIDSVYTEGERMENGTDLHFIEMQRDVNRQISEYKFKLSKAEQEMATMEQNVNRLEGQVSRYKSSADNAEKIEDELKAEKRKLQRELRTALDKIEEMEMTNNHLIKRLEKMKANRNALLSQQ
uniref:Leucine-rich repeat flightless-interacting protein 2 n=1 Tax=Sinocyclocheilus grahami TaxID=75366 RepID=A0A672P465_SINGR